MAHLGQGEADDEGHIPHASHGWLSGRWDDEGRREAQEEGQGGQAPHKEALMVEPKVVKAACKASMKSDPIPSLPELLRSYARQARVQAG